MSSLVLLVDDNATIRSVVRIYLMGMDLSVLDAQSAERALEILETARVHLIIADLNMPGMDGLTFIRRIREDGRPTVRDVPIILLSGEKGQDVERQGAAAGANQFISKPVTALQLRTAVEVCLEPPAA